MIKELLFNRKAKYLFIALCAIWIISSCTKDKVVPPVINTTVSFRQDIYPVFASSTGHCGNTLCHTDQFSLPWFTSADSCRTSLLRDTSVNIEARTPFINLEQPESSYLYIKLTSANPTYGERMPKDGPYLSPEFTAKVLAWIKQGAPDN